MGPDQNSFIWGRLFFANKMFTFAKLLRTPCLSFAKPMLGNNVSYISYQDSFITCQVMPNCHGSLLDSLVNMQLDGPSLEPSPEPSPEPCWTWRGFAPRLPGTFSGLLRNPVEPDLALHQSLPDLLRNLIRNLLRNPVWPGSVPKPPRPSSEPSELSPERRWTWPGACTTEDPLSLRCWGINTRLSIWFMYFMVKYRLCCEHEHLPAMWCWVFKECCAMICQNKILIWSVGFISWRVCQVC